MNILRGSFHGDFYVNFPRESFLRGFFYVDFFPRESFFPWIFFSRGSFFPVDLFLRVESYQWHKNGCSSGYPARHLAS